MPARSTILAVVTRAMIAIAAWLVCALPVRAGASSGATTATAIERARITQTFSIRQLVRQARYVNRPLAKRLKRALHDLQTRTNRIGRSSRVTVHDDNQAIQNDAPAMQIAESVRPALRPIGLFIHVSSKRPFTPFFARRSPRGPPVTLS